MSRVFKISIYLKNPMDVPSGETFPIFDDSMFVVGAFLVSGPDTIAGFVAGHGYQLALTVTCGDSFYFTPVESKTGKVDHAIITSKSISINSVYTAAGES